MFFNREKSQTQEWKEKVREENSWVTAIHDKLTTAVPVIIEVLTKGREPERVAAASLLATLRDNPKALDALIDVAADPHLVLSATATIAIGSRDDVPLNVLQQCFERASNDLVRTVAAIQLLFHADRNSPPAAVEHLLKQLRAPDEELRKAYGRLPDVESFFGDAGKALSVAPRAAAEEAFPLLYEQVKNSPYSLNYNENYGLLILAIMLNPPPERNWAGVTLTREQRLAVRLIADRAWQIERGRRSTSINLEDLFKQVGLPNKREEIFELLAGTPEGVQTEREIAAWSNLPRRPWWKRLFG
jgi:HEAT repeat protein